MNDPKQNKSREDVMAEREAKKKAKQEAKLKLKDKSQPDLPEKLVQPRLIKTAPTMHANTTPTLPSDKIVEQNVNLQSQKPTHKIKKKIDNIKGKHSEKENTNTPKLETPAKESENSLLTNVKQTSINVKSKGSMNLIAANVQQPKLSKAERRAIQEAQRTAKAQLKNEIKNPEAVKKVEEAIKKERPVENVEKSLTISSKLKILKPKVKLFSHLYEDKISLEDFDRHLDIHPAVVKLGIQYVSRTVAGSNARCIAFLDAMKQVIRDYETPTQKEFSRGLEAMIQSCVAFLRKCRPISVSMTNAIKAIKRTINHLNSTSSDKEQKEILFETIETYIRDQLEKAAQAISTTVREKIASEDVILTFGCSSLIQHILFEAHDGNVDFRVIVVDARPLHEGQEMLRRLVDHGIQCVGVLINAIGFIMPEVTKVLIGAHSLLANGYVMSRAGTAQIAMVAKSFNVPVLVCCETHKFSDRVQTDAFVYNEIGNPEDLILSNSLDLKSNASPKDWIFKPHITPLHLYYDVTPPELVTAVVTEVAILPCTSVPVILRIKPSEIYY